MKCSRRKRFTAEQEAAIRRLYCQQQLSGTVAAKRLHLDGNRVYLFLHQQRLLRRRGYRLQKLGAPEYQQLKKELLTTTDIVLARRYGLGRERVRQIRQGLGYPSSQVLRHEGTIRARAERREQEKLARELRKQQRRASQLPAINRLSARWKAGASLRQLAEEYGVNRACIAVRIGYWRKLYPHKFPRRVAMTSVWRQARERRWRRYWQTRLPSINRLSERWKSGATVRQLAQEQGISLSAMGYRIGFLCERYPEKFPRRLPPTTAGPPTSPTNISSNDS